jgi:hypothetical protein
MTHALHLANPGELIAVVPFLLGFEPRRSILGTDERRDAIVLPYEQLRVACWRR